MDEFNPSNLFLKSDELIEKKVIINYFSLSSFEKK